MRGRIRVGSTVVLMLLGVAVAAQGQPAAGGSYLESVEDPVAVGGEGSEVDSLEAQAEAIADGGTAGLTKPALKAIEEIVVSARKRQELLEDTPISITALGVEELRESNVERLDDIARLVPNLQIERGAEGYSANIVIRGVGNPYASAIAFDPGVGVYVDGVYMARAMGALLDIVDVEQIEVLRGPQGTLFGKNTVGGALNITTKKPTGELEGFALVRPGNRGTLFTQAILNVPILRDRLFVRGAFSSNQDRGFSKNIDTGKWYSARNSIAFLGSLRWLVTDDLTLDVSGTWSREHTGGAGGQCIFIQPIGLGNLVENPPGMQDPCEESTPRTNSSNVPGLVDLPSYGAWATASWDIGELGLLSDLSAKSITSWREQNPRLRSDVDQTRAPALWRDSTGGGPLQGVAGAQRQISQELQVAAAAWEDRFHIIAGAFGYWETGTDGQVLDVTPIGLTTLNLRTIDNWNWALFTQATLDPVEWLSLTAGIRYTEDKKGLTAQNFDALDSESPIFTKDESAKFDAVTPMASVALSMPESYLVDGPFDHLMGYFSYAQGFRGGGFNGVIDPSMTKLDQFGPETLDSFEVGLKTIAFDQRLTFNMSLFMATYDDIQVTTQVEIEDPGGSGLTIGQVTSNAARAGNRGAEFEVIALPIEGMIVQATLGLMNPRYADFRGSTSQLDSGENLVRDGESFNNAPQAQSHIAIQYSLPVRLEGAMSGWLTPRLEWDYRSSFHSAFPEIRQGVQPSYNLLHARLSYAFLDDRAQIAFWGRNLTDKVYLNYVTPVASSFGFIVKYYDAPRTFGAELSYSF
ncbi:MAG: TonB-dependent receptor [Candidatus Binatia bacterium]|nr:TonB-dependent receptor [Candidatus Binatia bacterium]MDG2011496.1 TonB-dependent receptor [Candidatus Binatia bacterium]